MQPRSSRCSTHNRIMPPSVEQVQKLVFAEAQRRSMRSSAAGVAISLPSIGAVIGATRTARMAAVLRGYGGLSRRRGASTALRQKGARSTRPRSASGDGYSGSAW